MYYVTRCFTFDAAHFLKDYQGKCANLHGHTFKVEITVKGKTLDIVGMLIDFGVLKNKIGGFIDAEYDHSRLNDIPPFSYENINPTAENLAEIIYLRARIALDEWKANFHIDVKMHSVKVYETADNYAEYREEEMS